jgi:Ca2+-transporting ATPase
VLLAAVLGLYLWTSSRMPVGEARGAAFCALVLGNLALALADATSRGGHLFAAHRRPYWLIAGAACGLLAVVLLIPGAARMFEVTRPTSAVLGLAVGVALLGGGWSAVGARLVARRAVG